MILNHVKFNNHTTTTTTTTTCVTTENGHCFLRCEKFSRFHGRIELYW